MSTQQSAGFSQMSHLQRTLTILGIVLLIAVVLLAAAIVLGMLAWAAKAVWVIVLT